MSNPQKTLQETPQKIEDTNLWSEVSEVLESTSNEAKFSQQSTEIQIETQQSTETLKQDITKNSFCNYMKQNWTPLESQSQEIQNLTQQILRPKTEQNLTKEQKEYSQIKSSLLDSIKKFNITWIIKWVKSLITKFFKSSERKINIWKDINYTPNKNDKNYIINAISVTLDPERRSNLTYLLSKIKDEEEKENLKSKWIETPSQFQLFLQNCKPWQMLLTNAESTWAKRHARFSKATQIVSGARRCHAAVISWIQQDNNGVITDASIIQATWKWIKEVSLKDYIQKEYKNSDFLVWTFQPPEKWNDVINKCKNYIWWKYSQVNLVADTLLNDPRIHRSLLHKQAKKKYCSELVFTWMQEAWLQLPDPHTTPADLLSTHAVTPEYCCYCDNFS